MTESTQEQTTCSCNHLTNFAVLMEVGETKVGFPFVVVVVVCCCCCFCVVIVCCSLLSLFVFVVNYNDVLLLLSLLLNGRKENVHSNSSFFTDHKFQYVV